MPEISPPTTNSSDSSARVEAGLSTGRELREWAFEEDGRRTATTEAPDDAYATAVVVAVYGDSDPLL